MFVNNRIWIVGAAIIMVAVVALGWFLGAQPKFGEIAANEAQRQAAIAQNQAYAADLVALEKDFKDIKKYQARLEELQRALPDGPRLSSFIGSLHELEAASGAYLNSFASGDPETFVYLEGNGEVAPVTEAPVQGSEGDAPVEETPTTTERVVPVDPPTLVQTISAEDFIEIQINLTITGTPAQILDFVEGLQVSSRRFLVTEFSFLTDPSTPGVFTGKIGGSVYVLIDRNKPATDLDEEGDISLDDPLPEPEASPSSSPSPSGSPTP